MRALLTGAGGQLGSHLAEWLRRSGHELIAWPGAGRPLDLARPDGLDDHLDAADPDAVVHAAAVSSAAAAFRDPSRARAVNVEGTRRIADWCARRGRRLLFVSTDLVFDGARPWSREHDPAHPVLTYGQTKLEAEAFARAVPLGLVARLSLLYGRGWSNRASFFDAAIAALARGEPRAYFADEFRTPLHLGNAAELLVRLLESGATGLVHLSGPERLSRFDLMRRVAAALGFDPRLITANRQADVPSDEPRPADVSLDSMRLTALLPEAHRWDVESALRRYEARNLGGGPGV